MFEDGRSVSGANDISSACEFRGGRIRPCNIIARDNGTHLWHETRSL